MTRVLGLLARGQSREEILATFPYLEPEDIDAALRYAILVTNDETLELTE